jgi:hypothetical protein
MSGRKIRVDFLFPDERSGTLDEDTLDITPETMVPWHNQCVGYRIFFLPGLQKTTDHFKTWEIYQVFHEFTGK